MQQGDVKRKEETTLLIKSLCKRHRSLKDRQASIRAQTQFEDISETVSVNAWGGQKKEGVVQRVWRSMVGLWARK